MSSLKFELEAELRNDVGRGASRRLRQADKVPAVMYGADKEAVSIALEHNKVIHALSHEAFYSHILTLKVGAAQEKVILKSLQRHPVKPRIQHIDFLRVKADQKLTMHVPLHFSGEENAPGVKEGGIFSHQMNDVEVSCLPEHLPEFIAVDLSKFALNQTLHLSELQLPAGVELVALAHGVEGHDLPVVSLHIPRVAEEAAGAAEGSAAEGEAAAAEPAASSEEKKGKE